MTWVFLHATITATGLLLRAAVLVALSALGAAGVFYLTLPWVVQPLLRALIGLRYRVRVTGVENVPKTGPALFVANHTSWLDGFLLAAFTPRRGKAMVSADIVNRPVMRQLAVRAGMIPTPFSGPHAIRAALFACRAALDRGEAVGLFPEGQISRNGLLGPFQRGIEVILKGKEGVAVVPAALDNLWGSNFSRSGGHFFGKRPRGFRRLIVVAFGPPVAPPVTAFATRQAVLETVVAAREITGTPSQPLDTLDPSLPRWDHPELGLLTASTADIHLPEAGVHQLGQKRDSVGLAVPGVAIRVVNGDGRPLPPETQGRLQARVASGRGWKETGRRGSIDPDGFVRLSAG